ncbi:MAG: hypothetical protein J3K34DRAFT_421546 [Monoraphidium minutum]|nr:MAG: hypothetical protein J3K34DRAFT_421546 [Monoraphidium minutum]
MAASQMELLAAPLAPLCTWAVIWAANCGSSCLDRRPPVALFAQNMAVSFHFAPALLHARCGITSAARRQGGGCH